MSFIGKGFGAWRFAPGSMFAGWIPGLIVFVVFLVGFIALGINLQGIAAAVTPFADSWDEPVRGIVRLAAALAFVVAAVLVLIYAFTTITLIVGAWFYDRIWVHVEERFGTLPSVSVGFWRGVAGDIADALRMLIPTILVGLLLLVLGFIPVAGQVLGVVLGAFIGGWFLAVELTGQAFSARGYTLRERRRALKGRRALTLGFGVATYLLFLVPLGAVIVMPAAVAGATLLSRRVLGESEVPVAARAVSGGDRSGS